MILRVFLAAAAMVIATGVSAQARPDTRTMSCASVNLLVEEYGAVVMTTGPHTYKRFVSRRLYCDPWERLRSFVVPAADTNRCAVRAICYDPPFKTPWAR